MSRCLIRLLVWLIVPLTVTVAGAETLVIPGTGDSQELLRVLARSYMVAHPSSVIEIPESIGSSGGIKNVSSGAAVLARVARRLKPREQQAGLHYLLFAMSPVVFAANLPTPCLTDLSSEQLVAIYSGTIGDWSQLGSCPAHTIYIANREPGDSSRTVIGGYLPAFKAIADPAGKTVYSTPDTVAVLERYPYTLAYLPLAALRNSQAIVLKLAGSAPTVANVQQGQYPLVVPLGLVWKQPLPPLAEQFIAYLFSPEAQQLIRDQGLVPAKSRH